MSFGMDRGMGVAGVDHERRYLLTRSEAEAFVSAVYPLLTLEVHDLDRPLGFSRTTYLDTDGFDFLRSCDAPVTRRLRIREYAAARTETETPVLTGNAFLELKESQGTARSKARFAAPAEVIAELLESRLERPSSWARALTAQGAFDSVLPALREGSLRPRLTTWYRRASLVGEDGRVRITMDESVVFLLPLPIGSRATFGEGDVIADGPGRVLEVKHRGEAPTWLTSSTARLSEAAGFTKFRAGLQLLRGGRRHVTQPLEIPSPLRLRAL